MHKIFSMVYGGVFHLVQVWIVPNLLYILRGHRLNQFNTGECLTLASSVGPDEITHWVSPYMSLQLVEVGQEDEGLNLTFDAVKTGNLSALLSIGFNSGRPVPI